MKFHSNNCIYSTCCMKILYFDIIKEDDTSVKLHEYWIYHSHKFYRYMPKKKWWSIHNFDSSTLRLHFLFFTTRIYSSINTRIHPTNRIFPRASRNLSTISQTPYQLERIVALYRRPSFPRMFLSHRGRPSTRNATAATRWDCYSQEKGFPCRGRITPFQLTRRDKSWKRGDSTRLERGYRPGFVNKTIREYWGGRCPF